MPLSRDFFVFTFGVSPTPDEKAKVSKEYMPKFEESVRKLNSEVQRVQLLPDTRSALAELRGGVDVDLTADLDDLVVSLVVRAERQVHGAPPEVRCWVRAHRVIPAVISYLAMRKTSLATGS